MKITVLDCAIVPVACLLCLCGCHSGQSTAGQEGRSVKVVDGVRLNRIDGADSVDIPKGISNKAALDAVEEAIRGTEPGTRNNAWTSQWRLEMRDPSEQWIRVGLTARQHYLCVCYRIENDKLVPDVPNSRNMKQNGCKIHRKAAVWINRLNPLISMWLYEKTRGGSSSGDRGGQGTTSVRRCAACGEAADGKAVFCSKCGKKL